MNPILSRFTLAAVLAASIIAPTAARADGPATPLCVNQTTLFGGKAEFGAKTNPTLPGRAVAFDGSCSKATSNDIGLTSLPPDYWTWTFGDGATASGTGTPSHSYAVAGTYTVTLTEWARSSGTLRWTATHTITVLP
jgi:hypothetical protein